MDASPTSRNIQFFRYTIPAVLLSIAFVVVGLVVGTQRGDELYGLDFVGGTEIVVRFDPNVEVASIRETLENNGFTDSVIQGFEADAGRYSIRVKTGGAASEIEKVRETLRSIPNTEVTIDKEDFVGPVIGDEIWNDSVLALALSLLAILAYISVRFEWRFACGAITALVHDVCIAAAAVAIIGYQFNMGIIAALMTIIGYSVNDTIVIFDRIRENLVQRERDSSKRSGQGLSTLSLKEIMILSLNQTLSRTLLTALTVLFVVVVLWLEGGPGLEDFAFTLVIGTIAGTYSTIFIACPVALLLTPKSERAV